MAAADDEADGDGRVQVAAGDVADGVGHGQHGEAEGERDADEADAEVRGPPRQEARREHGAAAAAEDEPERADELGDEFVFHGGPLWREETR